MFNEKLKKDIDTLFSMFVKAESKNWGHYHDLEVRLIQVKNDLEEAKSTAQAYYNLAEQHQKTIDLLLNHFRLEQFEKTTTESTKNTTETKYEKGLRKK